LLSNGSTCTATRRPAWLEEFAGEALIGWRPRLISSYQKVSKVGQGTYSTVYKALDLHRNVTVALKKIRLESMDRESLEFMAREIVILRKLNHPNVIKLLAIASSREKGTLYLVFEYVVGAVHVQISCDLTHSLKAPGFNH
jgi:cyclin-dependent kinase 12/13